MKVALAIRMLNTLASRDIVTKEELAIILDTNARNIIEYKKELEYAGYEIETIRGLGGGYRLKKDSLLPNPRLTDIEKRALGNASQYLNNRYDFLDKRDFNLALGKVLNSVYHTTDDDYPMIIDRFPLAMKNEDIKERYDIIFNAQRNQQKVIIKYLSSKNKVSEHIIHPYKLYMYNLAWYVLAYNETINDIGYFKLNRIEQINKTNNHFSVLKTFNESNYLDQFGMKNNGDYYDVEIEFKNPYAALIKERIYGKNQVLEVIDDKTTILKCKMQNLDNIVSFVLGCGDKALVLAPDIVKEKLKEIINKIKTNYEM